MNEGGISHWRNYSTWTLSVSLETWFCQSPWIAPHTLPIPMLIELLWMEVRMDYQKKKEKKRKAYLGVFLGIGADKTTPTHFQTRPKWLWGNEGRSKKHMKAWLALDYMWQVCWWVLEGWRQLDKRKIIKIFHDIFSSLFFPYLLTIWE